MTAPKITKHSTIWSWFVAANNFRTYFHFLNMKWGLIKVLRQSFKFKPMKDNLSTHPGYSKVAQVGLTTSMRVEVDCKKYHHKCFYILQYILRTILSQSGLKESRYIGIPDTVSWHVWKTPMDTIFMTISRQSELKESRYIGIPDIPSWHVWNTYDNLYDFK